MKFPFISRSIFLFCPGVKGMSILFLFGILLLTLPRPSRSGEPSEPIALGNRLELFVDPYLIETMDGTALKLHEPRDEGPVLAFDKPWEGPVSGYVTVLYDNGRYQLYYRGGSTTYSDVQVTCYAESSDGIDWVKPNLGLYEVAGTWDNNVILDGDHELTHNFAPFIDRNPNAPKQERYKALAGGMKGVYAFVSEDGIVWKKKWDHSVFTQPVSSFDSLNCPFWSESEQKYLFYFRTYKFDATLGYEIRSVSRAESADFEHWGPVDGGEMSYGDTLREHLYTSQTAPYYRAPQIYIATAARLIPTRRVLEPEEKANLDLLPGVLFDGCSECVVLTTRGGYSFDRTFMEGFIRPGPEFGDWVPRGNYPSRGIVPTGIVREKPAKPRRQFGDLGESEMSMFARRRYGQKGHSLCRYSMRIDGIASVNAPFAGGEFVTKPLTFTGDTLVLNAATSAEGWMQVEIQDENGVPIPGWTVKDSPLLTGNWIAKNVRWDSGKSVGELAGETVRLRFVMRDADLYSIRFR